ncbi:MAG TPA: nickel pincer cofactor biosynthesis protein LarB [Steroidobacteraceae bacterium]
MGTEGTEIELDFDRRRRTGLDEAIFAQSKSAAQLDAIFAAAHAQAHPLLLTRLSAEKFAAVNPQWAAYLDYCPVSSTGIFGGPLEPREALKDLVCIVAAGSSDVPVAREAERTLHYSGVASTLFIDVGVAGLWRLTSRIDAISRFAVVIAVAGMDAAMPTVLGGLIPGMIIAVPTSVGYGVAAGGHTALRAVLASCAPGIATVNIDNGYGAACTAIRALRMAHGRQMRAAVTQEFNHQLA